MLKSQVSRGDESSDRPLGRLAGVTGPLVFGLFFASLVLVCFLIIIFFFFAWPGYDDVARLARGSQVGIASAVKYEYLNVTGRWAGIGLSYVLSSLVDLWAWYPILLMSIAAVALYSLYRLIRALTEGGLAHHQSWLIAAVGFVLFWVSMRRPADSLYHLTFAIENLLSVSLATLLVAVLMELRPSSSRLRGIALWSVLGAAIIATVALHELYGSILTATLGIGAVQAFRVGAANRRAWLIAALCAVLGLAIVVGAPGNWEKMERRHDRPEAQVGPPPVELFAHQAPYLLWEFVRDLRLLAATILLLTFPPLLKLELRWPDWRRAYWLPTIVAPLVGAVVAGVALPIFAQGSTAVPRVQNGLYLVFLTGWLAMTVVLTRRFAGTWIGRSRAVPVLRGGAAILFVAALGIPFPLISHPPTDRAVLVREIPSRYSKEGFDSLFRSNVTRSFGDLEARLLPYHQAMEDRWRYLRSQAGSSDSTLTLEPLPPTPFMVRDVELKPFVSATFNRTLAAVLDIGGLRVASPARGELSLGGDQVGVLELSAPSPGQVGLQSALVRPMGARAFLLRPPPPHVEDVSQAIISLPVNGSNPYAVRITAGIHGLARRPGAVVAVVELWSRPDGEGELLGRREIVITQEDGWVEIGLSAAPEALSRVRSIRVSSRLKSGNDLQTLPFTVKRVDLLANQLERRVGPQRAQVDAHQGGEGRRGFQSKGRPR